MAYSFKLKRGETVIYIILWIIVLLMPIFISNTELGIEWTRVQREWIRISPFLAVFLVHNYLLFPHFFIGEKRVFYFISVLVLIVAAGLLGDVVGELFNQQTGETIGRPPMGEELPMGNRPPMGRAPRQPQPWHKIFIDNFLVSVLVVGFNAAIKLTVIWQAEEQRNKELEKEKLKTELAFLKNQVSPHFFMNTLNNIHALIDINSEDAKESVIKLSKLMRYLLYDSDEGRTSLVKEIEFIKSYVDLMKLRFTEKVKVKLSFPETVPNIEIPPMLFTSLLENAFKHGISYQNESFVKIIMKSDTDYLYFRIKNSKITGDNDITETQTGGIGLENLHKRLKLIYNNSYSLVKTEDENIFEINIKLPING